VDPQAWQRLYARRRFLGSCALGLGNVALGHLLALEGRAAAAPRGANPLAPQPPHFAPRATNVIFIFAEGGPSQFELFVPKPAMKQWEGRPLPASLARGLGEKLAFIKPTARVWASPRPFTRHGRCGTPFSDWLPHLATCADDLCLVHTVVTDQFNHSTAQMMLHCGTPLTSRPSLGAWAVYGLGSASQVLPAFVVLGRPTASTGKIWSSGFLPSSFGGVPFMNKGDPVPYLSRPDGVSAAAQRARVGALRALSEADYDATGDPDILARLASYELAFRMKSAAPELMDLSGESAATREMYGVGRKPTDEFGAQCLLSRRLVERGVRFVLLVSPGWDHHTDLLKQLKANCDRDDRPVAALVKDLKRRGLLDTTLVVWGGEFGRTPIAEDHDGPNTGGRDHHPFAFTMWLAGGGVKGGQAVGRTDDFGVHPVEDPVPVHDLQATILHCLGLDHERLTFRTRGRDFRLTDVAGRVVSKLLA
jgi:hypothetical protein